MQAERLRDLHACTIVGDLSRSLSLAFHPSPEENLRFWTVRRNRSLGAETVEPLAGMVVATYSVTGQCEQEELIVLIPESLCAEAKLCEVISSNWALGSQPV